VEIEKKIENIIEKKISAKTIKVKESLYTQYEIYYVFYMLNKNKFRERDAKSKISLIKQIYPSQIYKDEKLYPFYKNFLYSDYLDLNFYKEKLEEINKEKFPVIDLYLNKGNNEWKLNKDFICFNFVIKSLFNQYSGKINKEEAKKITFEKTDVYRKNPTECDKFIEIINSKNGDKKLTKESKLENFLINSTTEKGKIFIELYKEYADNQNNLLNEIIKKINAINYETFECQEINIQEAQEEDLIFFKFENEKEFNEIFLMNTFREIYKINNGKSTIKYDNYNLFEIDFCLIEKILEEALIKNSFFLKTDEIIEMVYSNEEFLNDGISELNKNIQEKNLDENDKKEFIIFYEKYLEQNLINCFEIHKDFNNIVKYVNKNIKKVKNEKSLFEIINNNSFPPKINVNLKEFLKNNSTITVDKLSELIKFFEQLYFDIAMEKEIKLKEKIDEETKNKINNYYKEKNGQFITKQELSITIIKFLLNVVINQRDIAELIDINDNLFEYLNNKFLWNVEFSTDNRFTKEIEEYKKLGIFVKNSYDFYCYISNDIKNKLEKEKRKIKEIIKTEEKIKLNEEIQKQLEEKEKILIEQNNQNQEEAQVNNFVDITDDVDIEDSLDLLNNA